MYSSLIGKIAKSRLYAAEPERLQFKNFSLFFHGDHGTHSISYVEGIWDCTCQFFEKHRTCSHMMASQKILDGMVEIQVPSAV